MTLQQAVYPLTRALAARLAQRRRRRHRGHLDFRKTVRASLSYGGVPAEPKFRNPHPSKPEIMVVADISGSVASFARFTLHVRVHDGEPVLEGAVVGVHRRHRRGHALLPGVGRRARGGAPGQHRGRRDLGRRPLRLRPRVRDVLPAPLPGDHAEDVDHPARRRAQQLPRVAGLGGRRAGEAGPARVLARPRAARLLGHRRLDRVGVREVLRRHVRVPQPAPAPAVRRHRRRKG